MGMFQKIPVMRFFSFTGFGVALALVLTVFPAAGQDNSKRGRKYKAPPDTSKVEVTVLRATNGKPIQNASVIFHPLENGKDKGNMELKTNDEGKASIDLLEIGSSVRLQIVASGYQTYGEDYKVDKDNIAIEVKMKKPAEQYSAYKKNEGKGTAEDKAARDAADKADKDSQSPKAQDVPSPEPQKQQPDAASDSGKDAPKDSAPAPQGAAQHP